MNSIDTVTLIILGTASNNETISEVIQQLLRQYEGLGPLPGILLPLIEAFLPFLPLIVFVIGNTAAYGLGLGFLYSWIGTCTGAILVFLLIRKLGDLKWIDEKVTKSKQVSRITNWVAQSGFGPLFLLLCFPFSPSSVINVVAGISKVKPGQFILAVLLGKAVMIFSVSYVGSSIIEFTQNPVKAIVVLGVIGLFWFLGKKLEKRLQTKTYKKDEHVKED